MRKIIRGRWLIEKKFKAETQDNFVIVLRRPHPSVGGSRSLDQRGKNLVVKVGLTSEQALGREIASTANGREGPQGISRRESQHLQGPGHPEPKEAKGQMIR